MAAITSALILGGAIAYGMRQYSKSVSAQQEQWSAYQSAADREAKSFSERMNARAKQIGVEPIPKPPEIDVAQEREKARLKAQETAHRRRRKVTQTIFTSPLGVENPPVYKKRLLGE